MRSTLPKYHRLLRGLGLVIKEGSFIRSKGLIRLDAQTGQPVGHNGIPDLIRFFSTLSSLLLSPEAGDLVVGRKTGLGSELGRCQSRSSVGENRSANQIRASSQLRGKCA